MVHLLDSPPWISAILEQENEDSTGYTVILDMAIFAPFALEATLNPGPAEPGYALPLQTV